MAMPHPNPSPEGEGLKPCNADRFQLWDTEQYLTPIGLSEVEGQGNPAAPNQRRECPDHATPFAIRSRNASWKVAIAAVLNPAMLIRPDPAI